MARRDEALSRELLRKAELFSQAFDLYLAREWDRALALFEEVAGLDPDDLPTQMLVARCEALLADPPGDDWTGISRVDDIGES
jgi:adenylate cyclase